MGGERRAGSFISPYSYEWFLRAELAAAHGELESAVRGYRQALSSSEEDPLVIARLATALDRLGRTDEADEVLDEATSDHPQSEALLLARARIAERRGHLEVALTAYEASGRAAPSSATAPIELARLLGLLGARERADAVLSAYVGGGAGDAASAARARVELALGRRDAQAAAEAAVALTGLEPGTQDAVRAAEAALDTGLPDCALRVLDRLQRSGRVDALRVRALVASGRAAEAEPFVVGASPEVFGGLVAVARVYLAARRFAEAEEIAAAAGIEGEERFAARLVQGQAALARGGYARAAAAFAVVPDGVEACAKARIGLVQALSAQGMPALAAVVLSSASTRACTTPDDAARMEQALAGLRREARAP